MTITATEFKKNLGKYLTLAKDEDIYVTKNGKEIAKLSNPTSDKIAMLDSLVGIVPEDDKMSLEEIKEARLSRQ
ncbi:MAG: type II toxin-antitoxin system prevent-host-death family antitoxin [Bacillota bacterium]|nr:type II toxin-antitoxin system prevent-host-death family antitoxin [Bacillota bacterium]